MAGQPGSFDRDERYAALSAAGDPLERLAAVMDFELFRGELDAALRSSNMRFFGLALEDRVPDDGRPYRDSLGFAERPCRHSNRSVAAFGRGEGRDRDLGLHRKRAPVRMIVAAAQALPQQIGVGALSLKLAKGDASSWSSPGGGCWSQPNPYRRSRDGRPLENL